MVHSIKVVPADTCDEPSSEPAANLNQEQQPSSRENVENSNKNSREESKSKTKQYILIALVIFNTITCVALIITLPIVLKDDNSSESTTVLPEHTTSGPEFTTPAVDGDAILVLSTNKQSAVPFVFDFNG